MKTEWVKVKCPKCGKTTKVRENVEAYCLDCDIRKRSQDDPKHPRMEVVE